MEKKFLIKKKRKTIVRELWVSVLFGDLLMTKAQEMPLRELWGAAPERVGVKRSVDNVILEKGHMQSSTHLGRRLLWVTRHGSLSNYITAFLSVGRCKNLDLWNFLLKISNYLRACSAIFPEQNASSLVFTLISPGCVAGQWEQWLATRFL